MRGARWCVVCGVCVVWCVCGGRVWKCVMCVCWVYDMCDVRLHVSGCILKASMDINRQQPRHMIKTKRTNKTTCAKDVENKGR